MLSLIVFLFFAAAPSNVDSILAKWKQVMMPFSGADLTARRRQLVQKLVEASRQIESIYWRQSDPEGLKLYQNTTDPKLKRALMINGSRYDLLNDNRSFVGAGQAPPGRNLYPPGLTRAQIEQYVKEHPSEKDAIYNPYTVLRRQGSKLAGIPYHIEYKQFLERAANLLRDAAQLSDDAAFAKFLRMRADALLSDDYYPSDLAWLDLNAPKIDIIFAPYETYLDDVLGIKTDYEAAILIRNEPESRKLELYQKYIPDMQDALPVAAADRPSKRGHLTPMEVMDSPFRAGDLRHGYQAVADNLPNDPRIHAAKGTKKIFFKNFMDARVNYVVLPLAHDVMDPAQAGKVTGEGYLAAVVLHEISHELGPDYSRVNGKQVDVREAMGPIYSALEEAKADVTGMFEIGWLMDHGALPKNRAEEYYASYVAGIFRTLRYGTAEAHGRAELMEFNYLLQQNAIAFKRPHYMIDFARIRPALAALTKELLEQEAAGDRSRAEHWFATHQDTPDALHSALERAQNVPVDIDPVFAFPEEVR